MKIAFLNIERWNYDNYLDLSKFDNSFVFHKATNSEEILDHIGDAEVVVIKELKFPKEVIDNLPSSVKLIIEAGTGYNNIDIETCKKKGILVCNCPDYSSDSVAMFTMMLILNMTTSNHINNKAINNKDLTNFKNITFPYHELNGKTLGIIGYGNIGKKVEVLAKSFGLKCIHYSRHDKDADLDELLKTSDFITLHSSLNDESFHMINKDNIGLLKPTAYIINTARGALIDEIELIKALENKQIAGAGLDVLEVEPATLDNPLTKMDNVIITPHMAWNSCESRVRLMKIVEDNIYSYIDGNPINVVNK